MEKPTKMEKMTQIKTIPFFHPLSRRMHVIVVLMIGCFCMAYTRSNLGMSMTCIVNSTAVALAKKLEESAAGSTPNRRALELEEEALRCAAHLENSTVGGGIPVNNYGGEIVWDSNVQNLIFTGTFWGSLLSALPAGYLADRTSPSNLLQFAAVTLALTSAFFPYFALNFNYYAVFALRFLTGIGEGLMFPAVNAIISKWIPNQEKSQAVSLFTVGAQMSGALGVPLSASFCASHFKWPGVFYFSSIFILFWAVLLRLTTTNSPAKSKIMTQTERLYLERSLEQHRRPTSAESHRVPWRAMMTSKPVLACLYVSFCFNVFMTLMHSYLPSFLKEVLYLKMMDNGIFSALPHVGQMVTKMLWSIGIDSMKQKKVISNTTGCRVSQLVACLIGGSMLLAIAFFADCTRPRISLLLFMVMGAGLGPATSGFYTSMVTLAPSYTGTLSSISMIVGFLGMLATPALVSLFRVYGTSAEWANVFLAIGFLVLSSGLVFACLGSGEVQPWGRRAELPPPINSLISADKENGNLLKYKDGEEEAAAKPQAALLESAME